MKIVFMGTPHFAVASLQAILQSKHQIVGVITAPDKAAGRGRKIRTSAVKEFCIQNNLKVLQPNNLKNPIFLEELRQLQADLFVVVAFRMLPKMVWQMPKFGTFNLHASLLPNYRGAAPINWAIINQEKETGVSTFFIDEQIDTGQILMQKSLKISPKETAGSLHNKLMPLGAELVLDTIEAINDQTLQPKDQDFNQTYKSAPKIQKSDCQINWNQDLAIIDAFVRGFNPYPTAWTFLQNGKQKRILKVFAGSIEKEQHNHGIGQLFLTKKEAKVSVNQGFYYLQEVQLEGKKRMPVQDFINGLNQSERYTLENN